jgi:hypothetical protein
MKKFLYDLIFKEYHHRKLYMIGLSHILNIRENYPNIKKLSDVDYKIFSQNGEDGILDYILHQLNIDKPKFIEIGVGDYIEANTRFIFERCSPKGAIIDCMEDLEQKVKKNIKLWKGELKIINRVIDSNNIHEVMKQSNCSSNLDIFSLDIDGVDYWILDKLPENFSNIAILEYNPTFGSELEVSIPNIKNFDRTKYHYSNLCFGMSLKAAIKIMNKKNFYFLGSNLLKNNAFFVSNEFKKEKFFKNLIIDRLEDSTNSNFTESRDIVGNLNYLDSKKRIKEISECEVVDLSVSKNKNVKLKSLL